MDDFFRPLAMAIPGLLPLLPPEMVETGMVQPGGKVYMTRDQALRRAFPNVHEVLELRHLLTDGEKAELQKQLGRRLPERGYLAWLAFDRKGKFLGLSVLTAELGKTEPFFLMLSLDPQGRVRHVDVLEYREPRGAEVRRRSFLGRYVGLGAKNLRRALRRIPVLPGATLSSHAVSRAVQKAIALHRLYLQEGTAMLGKKASALSRLKARFQKAKAKRRTLGFLGTGKKKKKTSKKQAPHKRTPKPLPSKKRSEGKGHASLSLPAMGDLFFAEFEGTLSEGARRALASELAAIEARWSPHLSTSVTARFNQLEIGEAIPIKEAEASLLRRAICASRRSGGAFTPVRDSLSPEQVLGLVSKSTAHGSAFYLKRLGPGCLDPGGFVKGWASDQLCAKAKTLGLEPRALGFRSSFLLPGIAALATSSTERRGPHIRDPRSGTPILQGAPSLVLAPSALEAEFLSTSRFVQQHWAHLRSEPQDPSSTPLTEEQG